MFAYHALGRRALSSALVAVLVLALSAPVAFAAPTPTAHDDTYSCNEGEALTVSAPGVFSNDEKIHAGDAVAVLVQPCTDGTITLSADGGFTYTPDAGFFGQDSFSYYVDQGAGSNTANVTITVVERPRVSSLSLYAASPGATITVSGSGFGDTQGASDVTFAGTQAAAILSWSATEIVAQVPAGATAGYVGVVANGMTSNGLYFVPADPPILSSMSAYDGAPGSQVTFYGSYFGDTQGSGFPVFSGVAAQVVSWSDTEVTAIVPTGTVTGYAGIVQNGLTSNGRLFVPYGRPAIDSLSNDYAFAGTIITVNGSNFRETPGTLTISGTVVTPLSWSDTEITFRADGDLPWGYVGVTQDGRISNGKWLTVVPRVDSISTWWASPGDSITFLGEGFGDGTDGRAIVAGSDIDVTYWSPTRIVARVVTDTVSGYAGIVRSWATSNGKWLTVTEQAHVTSVDKTWTAAGELVTLTGTGFGSQSGYSWVAIGGTHVCEEVSWTDTQTVVRVPEGAESGYIGVYRQGVPSNGKWIGVVTSRDIALQWLPGPADGSWDTGLPTPGDTLGIDFALGYVFAADGLSGLQVMQATSGAPLVQSANSGAVPGFDVTVDGHVAYVAGGAVGFAAIDVDRPDVPVTLDVLGSLGGAALDVVVQDGVAYLATGGGTLDTVDVSDPANLVHLDTLGSGDARGVAVQGDYAYLASTWQGLGVVDVSDPSTLGSVTYVPTTGHAYGVTVADGYAYVATWASSLDIFSLADPANPVWRCSVPLAGHPMSVSVVDDLAYVAAFDGGVHEVFVADPSNPWLLRTWDIPGSVEDVDVHNRRLFVASHLNGVFVVDRYPDTVTGYSVEMTQDPGTIPDDVAETTTGTYTVSDIALGSWYAHVRILDGVPGGDCIIHTGPIEIQRERPSGSTYIE